MLEKQGWIERCTKPNWMAATLEQCKRNHTEKYLDQLHRWCEESAGRVESDTVVSSGSPGHHALRDAPMGFCLLNSVSIAAQHARSLGCEKVLIVDWDVHHGNGTQASFWEDPTVGFVSIHRFPFYPGTGRVDETGTGDALGTTVNIPVSAQTGPKSFLDQLATQTEKFATKFKPDLILLSAGFDAHENDPVGGLSLQSEHYFEAGKWIAALAKEHCQGRLVSLLEGGYHLEHLPESLDAHLRGFISD
jgi:acetoin utilization deacetylase AcuC-like enzyme